MQDSKKTEDFILVKAMRFEPGYFLGSFQPSVLISVVVGTSEVPTSALEKFDKLSTAIISKGLIGALRNPTEDGSRVHPVLARIVGLSLNILASMKMPIMSGARVNRFLSEDIERRWLITLPAVSESISAPQSVFQLVCEVMNKLVANKSVDEAALLKRILNLTSSFRPRAPSGANTLRFLQAAHEMSIPWRHVAKNVYQFGWGKKSCWLDSTFTEQTSTISANLARDKMACAEVLRKVGLPVAEHRQVRSAEEAVKVAESYGYPVVIKPADNDGGRGVIADVKDRESVVKAFSIAAKFSKRILVERFIIGEDYRVRICRGEVIGAICRRAASILGDGQSTARELIEQTNRLRASSVSSGKGDCEITLHKIELDEEILSRLKFQGLSLDSVVPANQEIRLRGAANISKGGTMSEVMQEAHPDNLELALHAASALRLDVAGVDLLLPDIKRSWRETKGTVCEVNSQPQFFDTRLHKRMLSKVLPAAGRIPVIVVMHSCVDLSKVSSNQKLLKQGMNVEIAKTVSECHRAMLASTTDALIWDTQTGTLRDMPLPFDKIDVLIYSTLSEHTTKDGDRALGDSTPRPLKNWGPVDTWVLDSSTSPFLLSIRLVNALLENHYSR